MELSLVLFLNHLKLPFFDTLTEFVSNEMFLGVLCILSLTGVYLFDRQNFRIVLSSVILGILLHFCITEILIKGVISEFIFRARPYTVSPLIHQIGTPYTDSSFPSSHMASTLAVLTVFFFFYKKYWPYMIGFILLMAFARVHNGMHYPSDVIVGALLGILYGISAMHILNYCTHRKKNT